MADHDESLFDRVKDALGMGRESREERDDVPAEPIGRDDPIGSGPPEMGVGLDREGTAGTGAHDTTGTGLDYDFEQRRVTEGGEGEERVEQERRESGM